MNRLTGLILKIIIYIIKNINKNAGVLIDVLENIYTLTVNVKTKTLEKMIKVLVLIVTGKIMEIVVDNKIVTTVEIIKIINNYITLNDVWMIIELWVMWIVYIVRMNTHVILINGISIIKINITGFILNIISKTKNAVIEVANSFLDTNLYTHETQNKGLRSCIPFV